MPSYEQRPGKQYREGEQRALDPENPVDKAELHPHDDRLARLEKDLGGLAVKKRIERHRDLAAKLGERAVSKQAQLEAERTENR
jgi:hypothetical protein